MGHRGACARLLFLLTAIIFLAGPVAQGQETLHVYGPGGPLPAMKEAAGSFEKMHGVKIMVTAGPTPQWIDQAKRNADIIFSGSEYMMTDFVKAMEGQIDTSTIMPLYLRPSAILVRPGNPRAIKDLPDLLAPGVKVLVVQGAGQTGLWEDMAGKKGDINTVRELRRNIVYYASTSAEAKKVWTDNTAIDAWIIWTIWQVANPGVADLVNVSSDYVIYRPCGVALTQRGKKKPAAAQFVGFLESSEGKQIFQKNGWMTGASGE